MADGVTGRDPYIIAEALAYAIATMDRLPPHRRSVNDQADNKKRLLEHIVESDVTLKRLIEQCAGP